MYASIFFLLSRHLSGLSLDINFALQANRNIEYVWPAYLLIMHQIMIQGCKTFEANFTSPVGIDLLKFIRCKILVFVCYILVQNDLQMWACMKYRRVLGKIDQQDKLHIKLNSQLWTLTTIAKKARKILTWKYSFNLFVDSLQFTFGKKALRSFRVILKSSQDKWCN